MALPRLHGLPLVCSLLLSPWPLLNARAQDASAPLRPVRVVIASTRLAIAADQPLGFRLFRVVVQEGKSVRVPGGNGFVFVETGELQLIPGSGGTKPLGEGEADAVGGEAGTTLHAVSRIAASVLHFQIVPLAARDALRYQGDGTATELFRATDAVPGLAPGPHEFSLTRVTSPVGAPAPPLHHRSGAALYYLLSGSGVLHTPGRDELRSASTIQYEPNGFVHTWENTGRVPLVFIQANISREGVPEIIVQR